MDKTKPHNQTEVLIEGNTSGQVAIGNKINQQQNIHKTRPEVSKADLEALHILINKLREQVSRSALSEHQEKALEKVSEGICQKLVREEPAPAGRSSHWLVVNPIVGKLVEAAGETIAHKFKQWFGSES